MTRLELIGFGDGLELRIIGVPVGIAAVEARSVGRIERGIQAHALRQIRIGDEQSAKRDGFGADEMLRLERLD